MRKAILSSVAGIVCLLGLTATLGGEGAIPIWEPTTIREAGLYVVTRNISATGPVITIDSSNVTLDLNGFTVESTGTAPTITATGQNWVTIRNGTVQASGVYTVSIQGGESLLIERIRSYSGFGIRLEEVDDPIVRGNAVSHSSMEGIYVSSLSDQGGIIEDNQIEHTALVGIYLDEGDGFRISDNVLSMTGALFSDEGISVDGHGCILKDNLIYNSYGDGIVVNSDRNHVEGNVLSGNNRGLLFTANADDNVYRGNSARGNSTDLSDLGTGNTSHGDNYMPGQI